MHVQQTHYIKDQWSIPLEDMANKASIDMVMVFGTRFEFEKETVLKEIYRTFPHAIHVGCSSCGEIMNDRVYDDSLIVSAIRFDKTPLKGACVDGLTFENGYEKAQELIAQLPKENLSHVYLLCEGYGINQPDIIRGIRDALKEDIPVTGGFAADHFRYEKPLVYYNGEALSMRIAAVGFYGDAIKVSYGTMSGFDGFGPIRQVTKSQGNRLQEIEGESAVKLYEAYFGAKSDRYSEEALNFPLSVRRTKESDPLIRTLVNLDEESQSMLLAGDVPQGHYVQFMKGNLERIVEGALDSANQALKRLEEKPEFAILVSCLGRRLTLKQSVEDETEGVLQILQKANKECVVTGFYSYGEIAPLGEEVGCEIHNQTMTITLFSEK
jgi:hypothetical protein